ncbi:MAG: ABC transporter substrate-binding protein [Methanothrix sp.]|jgi:iron complex transport system substrate-binding protein|nr:ABC transporter substrate-binding protein [Methanothrix sp.]
MKSVCCILALLALVMPIAAAEQQGSTDLLRIFGNANMDDRIDDADAAYVQGIVDGKCAPTKLSDANLDGRIDSLDIDTINEIIKGEEKELTVSDSIDRNVTIKMPAKSLIALGSYRNEAVKILNAQDMMVGVSSDIIEMKYYYPELADKPAVGTWSTPDSEAIVNLRPDIVITSANRDRATKLEESLKSAGIAVLGLDFYRDNIIRSEMKTLGFILNKNDEADRYLQWRNGYEQPIRDYVAALKEDEKSRLFMEWGSKNTISEISSYGKGSSGDSVCDFTGGRNIAADLPEYPKVDSEWVLKENPDVIIKSLAPGSGSAGWNSTKEAAAILKSYVDERPGWSNLDAAKNNRIYLLSTEIAWGPDGIVGDAYYARWLNPEIDIDPEKIYKEYLEMFMGLEYPEGVVLGYPEK